MKKGAPDRGAPFFLLDEASGYFLNAEFEAAMSTTSADGATAAFLNVEFLMSFFRWRS